MSRLDRVGVDPWEVQLRKGSLELAVLASLWGGRAYGLEILKALKNSASLIVPEGTIYPLLSRLKAEGLLTSQWVEAENGRPRKYYRLTEAGRGRLLEMARIWDRYSEKLDAHLRPLRRPTGQ